MEERQVVRVGAAPPRSVEASPLTLSECEARVEGPDSLAVEEPLEIRIQGETIAVTMRTPGDDAKLALGFLFSEGIVSDAGDVSGVAHCGRPDQEGYGNTIEVTPAPGAPVRWERAEAGKRGTLTTAACGVCGRRSVDDLLERCPQLPPGPELAAGAIVAAMEALRSRQTVFSATGGTHAAAAFDRAGEVLAAHEDVGRHNAVDKVVGALMQQGVVGASRGGASPGATGVHRPALLAVSGRGSFEIVQKAAMAGIPVVACVSAPSTLAVDLAEKVGITLVGFVRGRAFNLYSHPGRVAISSRRC
jgi:FdhD protein